MFRSIFSKLVIFFFILLSTLPAISMAANWSTNTQLNEIPEGLDGLSPVSSPKFVLNDDGEKGVAVWLQYDYTETTRLYFSYYDGSWSDVETIDLGNGEAAQTPDVAINSSGQVLVS